MPQQSVEKLAALVPPPRVNQVRSDGVLASRLKVRGLVLLKVETLKRIGVLTADGTLGVSIKAGAGGPPEPYRY